MACVRFCQRQAGPPGEILEARWAMAEEVTQSQFGKAVVVFQFFGFGDLFVYEREGGLLAFERAEANQAFQASYPQHVVATLAFCGNIFSLQFFVEPL